MWLDNWMIVTLCIAFGACAFISRRQGFVVGAINTIQALEEQKLIKVEDDGSIKRWTPYAELPVKGKKRK